MPRTDTSRPILFGVLLSALSFAIAASADVRVRTDREEVIVPGALQQIEILPDAGASPPVARPDIPLPGGTVENSPLPTVGAAPQHETPPFNKLTVGDLARRIPAGGTLTLAKGAYLGGTITRAVTVRCDPGARIYGTGKKAALRIDATPVVIDGCQLRDARARYNAAGIWAEPRLRFLTVRNSTFLNNGNGIIVGNIPDAVITIEDSTFSGNGAGGRAHQVYISGTDTRLFVRRSTFRNTVGDGHVIKTGAARTVIEETRILGSSGDYSRAIDAFAGGIVQLSNVVIVHGPRANEEMIAFGAELGRAKSRVLHRLSFDKVFVKCLRKDGCMLLRTWLKPPDSITGVTVEGGKVNLVPLQQ